METQKPKTKKLFVRPKKLKQDLERVTQEMYLRNLELAETNRTLSLLRTIDKLVLESNESVKELCNKISAAISQSEGYSLTALFSSTSHRQGQVKLFGWDKGEYVDSRVRHQVENVSIHMDDTWLHHTDEPIVVDASLVLPKDISNTTGLSYDEYKLLIRKFNIRSFYVAKLTARQKLVGLMIIGFPGALPEKGLSQKDKELLERLSDAVGVALDNKLLLEENQRVLRQLQKTNEKLKELDETKDEFISMASHQLRTPLTSVKGYLSMVLDGDAGKLNDMQKKLLNQAFVSSQRMVYLIADLLNVSRLKTGKFIIEATPTNLADVVESEIAQLKEVANAKKLTLTYKKPDKFPLLMLDETKTRQVVMNFVDNAIYYTQGGGHVNIELKHDRSHVYFLVKDDGIGIPKKEQDLLFTKFYRASNARKARPDGTGLGLFMAKRVVTAQNGTILFESKEGEGSTFGFKFKLPKKR